MMRYIQYAWLALFLPSISLGAIDLDVDKNGATDVTRGGSNATTAAGARSNLGLGNVTNTSDANKPVSTAQQSALDLKSNITCFANASAFNTCFGLDWITATGIGLGTTDSPAFTGLTLGIANTSFGTLGFYGNSKTYPFSLWSDGADVGSLGWKLPSTLPSTASLISSSTLGYLSYVDPSTFLTPTGNGGALTVTSIGFDGNLTTFDNTLQEIAQKVDDLVLGSGGGYSNLTEFVGQIAWRLFYSDGSGDVKELAFGSDGEYLKSNGAAIAPSWATPSGAAHDAVTLDTETSAIFSLSTQQITLDSQTANTFLGAPNGSAGDPTFRALVAADIPTLNQNTTGSAATLTTARTIGGVPFNGSANINLPGVNVSGTQNTSGTAAGLTSQYIDWNSVSGGPSIANKPTIPTAASLSVDDLITLSGVATGAVNLGAFTGTTIADNSTVKDAIQSVETAVETKANTSGIAFESATWADLKILDTTHVTPGTGISIVQDVMAYGNADDAYHLWSIDKVGSELALKANIASPTFTGKVTTAATATGGAGFNLPHGTAPTSPVNGDFWTTTLGVYARINGSTVGPFGSSAGLAASDIDTSSELDTIVSDNTGSGALVFATSPTLVTPALGTPSALVLTNATGLPLSGVVDSTTEALGAGTIELGHASDTTIARSGAGVVTIEGVTATRTIASGVYTVDTASIPANTCAAAVAVTATNTATTDTIVANPNAILSSIAGFGVTSAGAVRVDIYPTANNVNFQFCNPTGAAIDPGSVTFNWKVLR